MCLKTYKLVITVKIAQANYSSVQLGSATTEEPLSITSSPGSDCNLVDMSDVLGDTH